MNNQRFEMGYYATYYYANIIEGVLADQFTYLRNLNEFYGDGNCEYFLEPFQKCSIFHQFIDFIIDSIIHEELRKAEKYKTIPIKHAFDYYKLDYLSFKEWSKENKNNSIDENLIYDYYSELYLNGDMQKLIEQIREEVFFVTFTNRGLLRTFNIMIANVVSELVIDNFCDKDCTKYMEKDGVLKRVTIPSWVKKAVYYRDRGRCVICNKDLSGVLSLQNVENYDHIVPLAQGGLNDVTNIQLLCDECNRKKLHYTTETSLYYEKWY